MLFTMLRLKWYQYKTVDKCDLREQIEAVIEEKKEIIEELEKFLFRMKNYAIKHSDLHRATGNIIKEIEDDATTNYKLKLLFNRTYDQRKAAAKAKRKIANQLQEYLKRRGAI